jgi:hypothetical protein
VINFHDNVVSNALSGTNLNTRRTNHQQATRKKHGWDSQRPSLQRVPEILRPAMVMLGTVWPEMERLLHGH